MATFEMTSLAFMFVDVPEPVWKMSTTKASSNSPSTTRWAAADDGLGAFGVECFEFEIHFGGALLYLGDGADEGSAEAEVGDGEVELGATGVCAVVGVSGDV